MTMVVLTEGRFVLGGVLLVVANLAFGMSVVVYNSFLPRISTPDERDRVSSRGWALGYLGGAVLLVVNLALYLGHEQIGLQRAGGGPDQPALGGHLVGGVHGDPGRGAAQPATSGRH